VIFEQIARENHFKKGLCGVGFPASFLAPVRKSPPHQYPNSGITHGQSNAGGGPQLMEV
jgi:hypothetical protein